MRTRLALRALLATFSTASYSLKRQQVSKTTCTHSLHETTHLAGGAVVRCLFMATPKRPTRLKQSRAMQTTLLLPWHRRCRTGKAAQHVGRCQAPRERGAKFSSDHHLSQQFLHATFDLPGRGHIVTPRVEGAKSSLEGACVVHATRDCTCTAAMAGRGIFVLAQVEAKWKDNDEWYNEVSNVAACAFDLPP